jgi:hypothetical protein
MSDARAAGDVLHALGGIRVKEERIQVKEERIEVKEKRVPTFVDEHPANTRFLVGRVLGDRDRDDDSMCARRRGTRGTKDTRGAFV